MGIARRWGRLLVLAVALVPQLAAAQGRKMPAMPVDVATVKTDTLVVEATAVGTLLSNEGVMIRPEIEGRIVAIGFKEGQPVTRGQMLFKLDDSIYTADLADAQARLVLARRNYDRAKELFQKSAGSARTRDEAQSQFQVSQAAVELARAKLSKTTIVAPFKGIVGLRKVSIGDYVTAGKDLVNLADIQPLKVEFSIPERYLGEVKEGQSVTLAADAFPGETFNGEIYAINPQIDPAGRSIQVRARVPNEDRRLRPGLFVRVKVQLSRRENTVMIPEQAIVPRGSERFVYKVVDGKAVETPVKTGHRRVGEVEIVEGLKKGDVIVTAGQLKIRDGSPVRPLPASASGGGNDAGKGVGKDTGAGTSSQGS